jgi:hypothetical protein
MHYCPERPSGSRAEIEAVATLQTAKPSSGGTEPSATCRARRALIISGFAMHHKLVVLKTADRLVPHDSKAAQKIRLDLEVNSRNAGADSRSRALRDLGGSATRVRQPEATTVAERIESILFEAFLQRYFRTPSCDQVHVKQVSFLIAAGDSSRLPQHCRIRGVGLGSFCPRMAAAFNWFS